MLSRGRQLKGTTDIGDALAPVEELLSGAKLVDDLIKSVAFAFHGASPCQVRQLRKLP